MPAKRGGAAKPEFACTAGVAGVAPTCGGDAGAVLLDGVDMASIAVGGGSGEPFAPLAMAR